MRENDGRRLDHKTLEAMRLRAVEAVARGQRPEDVAAALGMGRGTVYGWLAKYREGGTAALRARPVPGRRPKLSGEQMRRLYTLVAGSNPAQLQLEFALWTRELVRELIRREFAVSLSAVSVGRVLRTLGLSPQRPLWRAWQADPEAVQRWKDEDFPAIRAAARAEGATVYFADEAGIRSDYHAGTTWAPVGATPVVKATGARHGLNMISAVTAQGLLRFATFPGRFTAAVFIEFCQDLLADTDGPGLPGRRRPPRPPGEDRQGVPRHHRRTAQALRAARLLTPAEPRRMGLEERQARPRRARHPPHRRGVPRPRRRRAAPPAEPATAGPRLLRRSRPALHHRMIKSTKQRSA